MKLKPNWAIISIISRFTAQAIGIVQSFYLVSLLSVGDFGMIDLVKSISAYVGVYQNLGISSGSTREIAAAKNMTDAFKVFTASLSVRYLITIPLAIGLFILAPTIGADHYGRPEIVFPLRITAAVLLIQALQSVLNSVVQGLGKFKFLFTFQVAIAFVSLITYVVMITKFSFMGYFYALLTFNIISVTVTGVYALSFFRGHFELPNKLEWLSISKAVFSIGLFIYFIKIVNTSWEKLGTIYLGGVLTNEQLGIFAFAILVAAKIMTISDALTDVTLPSFTKVYERSRDTFQATFLRGTSKAFYLILFCAVFLILMKRELFLIIDYVLQMMGKNQIYVRYEASFSIMDPMIIAFFAYAMMNLLTSGLAVPTKKLWGAVSAYVVLFIGTVGSFMILPFDSLLRFSVAMCIGASTAYIFFILIEKRMAGFFPISRSDIAFFGISAPFILMYYFGISSILLATVYILVTAGAYYAVFKSTLFQHSKKQ